MPSADINGFGVTAEIGCILSLAVKSAKCYLKSWAMLAIKWGDREYLN